MKLANILSGILGLVLTIIAIRWIFLPEDSANSLGMVLLEGSGRNTQIRDFTSYIMQVQQFMKLGVMISYLEFLDLFLLYCHRGSIPEDRNLDVLLEAGEYQIRDFTLFAVAIFCFYQLQLNIQWIVASGIFSHYCIKIVHPIT